IGNLTGKPTMVATEVFSSMIGNPSRPSRGDVQGLYSAIAQGADAVMLAKETSFPPHADEVVRACARVIEQAEEDIAAEHYEAAASRPEPAAGSPLDILSQELAD